MKAFTPILKLLELSKTLRLAARRSVCNSNPERLLLLYTPGGFMPNRQTLLVQAYSAFNHRDIDGALALMTENVSWPKASEGGRVVGKEEIRAYWSRQWQEFDPHVEPLDVIDQEGGTTDVKVHQLVKSLGGDVLSDSEVWHVFTIANGLIERMDLKESESSSDSTPSTAFS